MNGKQAVEVDALDMLKEVARNFTQPLELMREAISNSYDAFANNVSIKITRKNWEGDQRWVINIGDDGKGMVLDEQPPGPFTGSLRKFFTLGKSMRRGMDEHDLIGEKGLGIKVAFHSEYLTVKTWAGQGYPMYIASSYRPWASIFKGVMPEYEYTSYEEDKRPYDHPFTEIEVIGFYDNDGSHFRADEVEDYIRWFTKWGAFEERIRQYLAKETEALNLHLSSFRPAPTGYVTLHAPSDASPRKIPFGHPFPDSGDRKIVPNEKFEDLISHLEGMTYNDMVERLEQAKRQHWRYLIKVGTLTEIPDVTWQAIISVEGDYAKRSYNPHLRQRQHSEKFSYKAEERYGLWYCKDFFCIQQANDVAMEVLGKEGQRTRFKILLNCQEFGLTAERKSVGNTDANILREINEVAKSLVAEMTEDDSWTWTELIEEETEVRTSVRQDKLQLEQRSVAALKKPVIMIEQDMISRQPTTEAETVLLLECLRNRFPVEFGFFQPLDWRTDRGIDCVVKSNEPGEQCRFVEFKKDLVSGRFNHTFASLHYVVCWQVKAQEGSVLEDPARQKMKLRHYKKEEYSLPETAPWTLEGEQRTIKVYALLDILLEKFGSKIERP